MAYTIKLRPAAEKTLAVLERGQRAQADQIRKKLAQLAEHPQSSGGQPLQGKFSGRFRVRVGDFRILYVVDHSLGVVDIIVIGDRKEVYR